MVKRGVLGAQKGRVLQEEAELGNLLLQAGEKSRKSLDVAGEVLVLPTLVVAEVADLAEFKRDARHRFAFRLSPRRRFPSTTRVRAHPAEMICRETIST